MQVKFLKAGKGDSILIQSNGKNMLIDGGDDSSYLLKELDEIHRIGECVDIMVITHHDSDHIKGIIDFLKELKNKRYGEPSEFVRQVYFNSLRLIKEIPIPQDSDLLSYKQASDAEKLISSLGLQWNKLLLSNSPSIALGDVKLTCLSPTEEIVDSYAENKGAFLSPDDRSDWNKDFVYLKNHISDRSIDNTLPNQSSIVLLLKHKRKQGLLTGDITPRRLEHILSDLYKNNENKPVNFDFIKLPHHGSQRSITKDIISKVNCSRYVISTDGNNHFLPDKKALLKVLLYQNSADKKISFLFNYSETLEKLRITDIEKAKFNFTLEPNNSDNGYYL